MKKRILVVYAHPEPASLTRQLVEVAVEALQEQGHEVLRSDLYGMRWKAVYDADDFPSRLDPERLSFIAESGNAYATGHQTDDVAAEQAKLAGADAVILLFPLWWFGVPAILKGWIERVFAYGFGYGYRNGTNQYRYGDGAMKGKRALVSVLAGGPEVDYGPRGINGPMEEILFPLTHGALFFAGMDVLRAHAMYGTDRMTGEDVAIARHAWRERVDHLFEEDPIAFRSQNGGDYPDRHTLREDIAPSRTGVWVHVAGDAEP